jgi:hypothetical protein
MKPVFKMGCKPCDKKKRFVRKILQKGQFWVWKCRLWQGNRDI